MWRGDGKELFYIDADNMVIAQLVEVTAEGVQARGAPTALFRSPLTGAEDVARPQYWPVANGSRFLFNVRAPDPRPRTINVLLNWPAALRR
jgi:hypothetical protein